MTSMRRSLIVIAGGVLSIPAVALLSFVYFQHMVAAEYASGERVSTDGDSLGIPVIADVDTRRL